ncbi:MAG: asparagine synthase (glutamine-hydrolyzing) [Rhodospirillales bacterium]
MCGIAGILGEQRQADERAVQRMLDVQRHRGPDGEGVVRLPDATLGHLRLAILDLSSAADQPMQDTGGRYTIVFNGEIYNYKELRAELASSNDFRGSGDTEVLLSAWAKWGEGCLNRLNGMFAFCIWDSVERTAYFARDRFGQKPLYVATMGDRLLFSSEIKGLLAGGVPASPNRAAWLRYLAHSSYDDNEQTFFDGVQQLAPGTMGRWSRSSGFSQSRWYHLPAQIRADNISGDDAIAQTRDLMIDATRIHMRSDVPVGVSLSGGLDSAAMLACFAASETLHAGTKAISAEFQGAEDYSERDWIVPAAAHHDLDLEMIAYTPEDFLSDFRTQLWHADGPLGGLMNLARARVMNAARNGDIKVMQDGTGLDEAFGGYQLHHDMYLGERIAADPAGSEQDVRDYAAHWGVDDDTARTRAAGALRNDAGAKAIDGTVLADAELLSRDSRAEVASLAAVSLDNPTGDAILDSLLDYILIRKIPRNTRFVDRMSMAFGVELRCPFLDHRLIELGLCLPRQLRFQDGRSKAVARAAMAGLMDETVRTAPKRSVHTPQGAWLRSDPIKGYVEDLINSSSFAARGFFDADRVRARFREFCTGEFANSFFVWQWINLEEWFRTFVDSGEPARISA